MSMKWGDLGGHRGPAQSLLPRIFVGCGVWVEVMERAAREYFRKSNLAAR